MGVKTVERTVTKYSDGSATISFPKGRVLWLSHGYVDAHEPYSYRNKSITSVEKGVFPSVSFDKLIDGYREVASSNIDDSTYVDGGMDEYEEDDDYDDDYCDCDTCVREREGDVDDDDC